MNKALMIGLGVAGAGVVGVLGYTYWKRGQVTVLPPKPVDPNRFAVPPVPQGNAIPGGMAVPPPPPGLPGVLSPYLNLRGQPLFLRTDGALVSLSGVQFGTGPDNMVVRPDGTQVYLKGGIEFLRNGIRAFGSSAALPYLVPVGQQQAAPPPSDPSLEEKAKAMIEEAKRKAQEALKAKAKASFSSEFSLGATGNRWSGSGRDHLGNHR